MSDAPLPKRVPQPAVDYWDMLSDRWPEMLRVLLPAHLRRALAPAKKKKQEKKKEGKGKQGAAAASDKKGAQKQAKAPAKAKPKAKAAKGAPAPPATALGGKKNAPLTLKATGGTLSGPGFEVTGVALNAAETGAAEVLARRGSLTHKWQYQENGGRWGDYDPNASRVVEVAYASHLINPHIDIRSIKSGDWEYMVDFNMMEQQNVRHQAHTRRKIRRVLLGTPAEK